MASVVENVRCLDGRRNGNIHIVLDAVARTVTMSMVSTARIDLGAAATNARCSLGCLGDTISLETLIDCFASQQPA